MDVNVSDWESSLEKDENGAACLRLGLHRVKGLNEEAGCRIADERRHGEYTSMQALLERTGVGRRDLDVLASAGALKSVAGPRHPARWQVSGVEEPMALFGSMQRYEAAPLLKKPTEGQDIVADYQQTGLSLERHPLALLRSRLERYRYRPAADLPSLANGAPICVAGLVITKQRPGTASGVTFVTLEDETGHVNLVVWKTLAERYRAPLLNARLMGVRGELQIEGKVIHVVAHELVDHSEMLGALTVTSRDFR